MKLTKRTLVALSSLTVIALVGVRLSLRTMEPKSLEQMAAEEFIRTNTSIEKVQRLEPYDTSETWAGVAYDLNLLKLLTSDTILNEFRDHGTIEGKKLEDLASNKWALNVFKPAMSNVATPFVTSQVLTGRTNWVNSVAFSPDGQHLASGLWASAIRIRKLQPDNTWGMTQTLTGDTGMVSSVAFSPDGQQLASVSFSQISIWTLQPDNNTWKMTQTLTGRSVAFSPDGRYLASGSEDNTIRIWTLQPDNTWKNSQVLTGHTAWVSSVAFSPDGQHLASGSRNRTVRIWTLQPDNTWGNPQLLTGHTNWVTSVAFSPDGQHLASGSEDHTIRIWTLQPDNTWGNPQLLTGGAGMVNSVAFSPDGRHLASGSDDAIRIWTLKPDNTWKNSQVLTGHTDAVISVAFSPDGQHLASGSWRKAACIWTQRDLVSEENVANKIMLLQLLARDGKDVINNSHLFNILETFSIEAQNYLQKTYDIQPSDIQPQSLLIRILITPLGEEILKYLLRIII